MKPWYQSRTIWFNIIFGLTQVLASADVIAVFPPSAVPYTAAAQSILNILLRLISTAQLSS